MQETQVQFLGQEDLLEKKTATHSFILAWKIPWLEEPRGLQSMGSQRVRHNLATKQQFISLQLQGTCSLCFWPRLLSDQVKSRIGMIDIFKVGLSEARCSISCCNIYSRPFAARAIRTFITSSCHVSLSNDNFLLIESL